MDEKKVLIAIALSILIMVGWYAMFPPPKQAPPTEPVAVDPQIPGDAESAPSRAPRGAPAESTATGTDVEPYAAQDVVAASSEERLTVDNQHFSAEFTNEGGRLLSFKLREFTAADQPLELLPPFAPEDQAYLAVDLDDRELAKLINRALFKTGRQAVTGGPNGGGGQRIIFEYSDGSGLEVRFAADLSE